MSHYVKLILLLTSFLTTLHLQFSAKQKNKINNKKEQNQKKKKKKKTSDIRQGKRDNFVDIEVTPSLRNFTRTPSRAPKIQITSYYYKSGTARHLTIVVHVCLKKVKIWKLFASAMF